MRKYSFPVEIHTHTEHSDATFTTRELIEASKYFGYKGIILTDHNSSSGYNEMKELGLTNDQDLVIIKGMEWTTYFGHMLAHDADYDVDWREATPDTIDTYIKEVKDANGLVGIAHPFDMGSPICTGCHWDFNVKDYSHVDYIEIWNSNNPHVRPESRAAYEMWLDKLDEGYRISASTGRDWHREDNPNDIMGVTYLELADKKLTHDNFINALEKGQFYSTLGPTVQFTLQDVEGITFQMGDEVNTSENKMASFNATIRPAEIEWLKKFEVSDLTFTLYNNYDVLYEEVFDGKFEDIKQITAEISKEITPGYLRFELNGEIKNRKNAQLLISNPIYFNI